MHLIGGQVEWQHFDAPQVLQNQLLYLVSPTYVWRMVPSMVHDPPANCTHLVLIASSPYVDLSLFSAHTERCPIVAKMIKNVKGLEMNPIHIGFHSAKCGLETVLRQTVKFFGIYSQKFSIPLALFNDGSLSARGTESAEVQYSGVLLSWRHYPVHIRLSWLIVL